MIADFKAEPLAPKAPKNKADSVPNLTLFITSRAASFSSLGFIAVGPPNKSPKVPTRSGSPTKIMSAVATPPTPPNVVATLPLAFNALVVSPANFSVALK